jgi:hypothetical protein
MTITDAERHRLHTKLDQVLGEEDAAVLISHLPPSGWSDVARTRDLDELERRMNVRFEATEARFEATLHRELQAQTTRFLTVTSILVTVVVSLAQITTHLLTG